MPALIGFVLVTVYMVLAYGLFGIFADIALLFNLILTIARSVAVRRHADPAGHRRHRC